MVKIFHDHFFSFESCSNGEDIQQGFYKMRTGYHYLIEEKIGL